MRSGRVISYPVLYLIGSLRNPKIIDVTTTLTELGFEVFSDWFAAGPKADDAWRDYEKAKGRTYAEALQGYAARHVFAQDFFHLNRAHGGVLVLPAGKSGHLEAGFLSGQGKDVFVLLEDKKEPPRFDVMTQFLVEPCASLDELETALIKHTWPKVPRISISATDIQWLAGLLEGEGSFCISRSGSVPRLVLQMTDKDVVSSAASLLKSKVWGTVRKTKGHKDIWACGVAGLTAIEWMRLLRPFLGIRRQHQILSVVKQWLATRKHRSQDREFWLKVFGLTKENLTLC